MRQDPMDPCANSLQSARQALGVGMSVNPALLTHRENDRLDQPLA